MPGRPFAFWLAPMAFLLDGWHRGGGPPRPIRAFPRTCEGKLACTVMLGLNLLTRAIHWIRPRLPLKNVSSDSGAANPFPGARRRRGHFGLPTVNLSSAVNFETDSWIYVLGERGINFMNWELQLTRLVRTRHSGLPEIIRTLGDAVDLIDEHLPESLRISPVWQQVKDMLVTAAETRKGHDVETATVLLERALEDEGLSPPETQPRR
jgi:hypothetical protein